MSAPTGYEFVFRSARLSLWLGALGALLSMALGVVMLAVAAPHIAAKTPTLPLPLVAAGALAGAGLLAVSLVVLRRALVQAHDVRVGEAGIYFRTLSLREVFVDWSQFTGFEERGRLVRLVYRPEADRLREVWFEVPRGREVERTRLRTFLEDRMRMRAAKFGETSATERRGS